MRLVPVNGGYWKQYSKKRRCPLAVALVAVSRSLPLPADISPCGVYTIRQAAAWLNMPPAAVRRLVRVGRLVGFADAGGFLLWGGDLLRFVARAFDGRGNTFGGVWVYYIISKRKMLSYAINGKEFAFMDCGEVCNAARVMGLSPDVRFVLCRACVCGCAPGCVCALGVLLAARGKMLQGRGAVAVSRKKRIVA